MVNKKKSIIFDEVKFKKQIMSILGFLVITVSIVLFILKSVKPNNPIASKWSGKKTILGVFIGVITMSISGMFFYNPAGTATSVQYLWGGDEAITSQGLKLKFWGKTIPISFEIAMQDYIAKKDAEGNVIKPPQEEGIYYRQAQKMEFADAIKADIATSLVVSVNYEDEETFLSMADKNRSEPKLVYARIYPVYDQALKNTCKLMDAQDYISGASSTFDFYLKDQMENGMYRVKEDYTSIEETTIAGDSSKTVAKGKVDNNNSKKQKRYVIERDSRGNPIRDASNSLKRYGLKVEQAAVTNIDWEPEFDKRLQLQKEQVAQTQLEKQEAEKEFYATKKAIAKGEREKAQVRVKLEKEQLAQTIAAETKALSAKYREKEEENLLAAEKKRAQRIKVKADADAYEIRKKVSAGITPERKLEMELNAEVAKEEARSKRAVPHTMIVNGGSNGKGISSETLLQMQLVDQMGKK